MPLPLNNKRMSIEEYYAYTGEERVELIDGFLYDMASPSRIHQAILRDLTLLIDSYIKENGGDCLVYPAPFGVQLKDDEDTIVEPDISVICDRDKLTDRGCVGAPDWIVEIVSPSSATHDYVRKYNLYKTAGVREYWQVNPDSKSVVVHSLVDGDYVFQEYSLEDTVKSGIYDDLEIDFGDMMEKINS